MVPFPATRDDNAVSSLSDVSEHLQETTQQVAAILHLPASEGLARIVADYLEASGISIVGEADAAREWMDDPVRNRKGQHMSLSFYRRWLQREVEASQSRKKARASPGTPSAVNITYNARTGTTGIGPPTGACEESIDPYEAFVKRRVAAVMQRAREEKETHEAPS